MKAITHTPESSPVNTRAKSNGVIKGAEWLDFIQLGTITQGQRHLQVCYRRTDEAALFMFKLIDAEKARVAPRLSLQHPNLVSARYIINSNVGQHIGFDYFRFTLEELLNAYLRMQDIHLRAIATSVWPCLSI